ncbi:hypothetical protein ACFE04_019493 [Oxalis oulophora]
MEEDLARDALHIQRQDEKIGGLAQESQEARSYNDYIMRKLESVLMQKRMLIDRNQEIRGYVCILRAKLVTQDRDNHFMHEAREVALLQLQQIENENSRMTNETIQKMNMIAMLNARNQNIVIDIHDMQNENKELQNKIGSLQEERNGVKEQYEDIKGKVEAMLPNILNINAKASMLAMFTCAPSEYPFEQFATKANKLLGNIVVNHAPP